MRAEPGCRPWCEGQANAGIAKGDSKFIRTKSEISLSAVNVPCRFSLIPGEIIDAK